MLVKGRVDVCGGEREAPLCAACAAHSRDEVSAVVAKGNGEGKEDGLPGLALRQQRVVCAGCECASAGHVRVVRRVGASAGHRAAVGTT